MTKQNRLEKAIEERLNERAWRHLTAGDFYGCDVCGAMGKCDCKIQDMESEDIAKALATTFKKELLNMVEIDEGKVIEALVPKRVFIHKTMQSSLGGYIKRTSLDELSEAISTAKGIIKVKEG